jgi:hypothetical protein
MAEFLNKLYHSRFPGASWVLDALLNQVLRGGLVFKEIEREIVQGCPVKDWTHLRD